MAEQLDDAEFWLPAKFLTDDDIVMEKENLKNKNGGNNTELLIPSHGFPTEFPYEFDSFDSSSALSSPVESVVGSTETESGDEDEFLAGLTRRLAHSTSQKFTVPVLSLDKTEKSGVLASSPQSTLSGLGSWSTSSNGSPNGPSQVPSPPTTPFGAQNDTWDLIYAAAGQVARLKMSNEAPKYTSFNYGRGLPKAQSHAVMRNSSSGLYPSQGLSYNLAQTNQYHGRQEQVLKPQCGAVMARQVKASNWQAQLQQQQQQHIQSRARNNNVVGVRPLGLPQSSWPPLQVQSQQQQQPQHNSGSGMRAMFLSGSGSVKRECAGTGVFLPRRYGNPPEPRKKSGCSTVLLPAKVVQALNLNFDDTNGHVQPHINPSFASNYDALLARRNALSTQARRGYRPEGGLNHEIHLPQEWTY
ncbi:PREDICTED: uncharacterized protein LOC18585980 [Theobroma cacao]|uniref:Uncharacterized protein LOC18585980 n=1 Tax=Theobroma cacao TaxID=3641 RepID=A0AB32ULH0_THECC|nr:PREDICTED: uncharacterized protein LOC18585980 [Theobroma cacao]